MRLCTAVYYRVYPVTEHPPFNTPRNNTFQRQGYGLTLVYRALEPLLRVPNETITYSVKDTLIQQTSHLPVHGKTTLRAGRAEQGRRQGRRSRERRRWPLLAPRGLLFLRVWLCRARYRPAPPPRAADRRGPRPQPRGVPARARRRMSKANTRASAAVSSRREAAADPTRSISAPCG